MKHLDLFSGIGGFALAAQWAWGKEYENVGFCDNDEFCKKILKKHWPDATIYDDIKKLDGTKITADIITGGFPCQPFSAAGKRRGKEDDRHLWPQMLRVIREVAPRWVIGENVGGLLTWNGGMVLDEVFADLEAAGYEVWAFVIPAVSVNAPHRRNRVWIIAHADSGADRRNSGADARPRASERLSKWHKMGKSGKPDTLRDTTNPDSGRLRRHQPTCAQARTTARSCPCSTPENAVSQRRRGWGHGDTKGNHGQVQAPGPSTPFHGWKEGWFEAATRLCVVDDGIPGGLVRPKGWRNAALKGAGNAIVPQVAEQIMRVIKSIE